MSASRIAPDLRVPWTMIPAGRTSVRLDTGGVGWLSPPGWNHPDATVVITCARDTSAVAYLDTVVEEFAHACVRDFAACPALTLSVLLSLWDSEFRAAGLFDGNVYLSSAAAVAAAAAVAGWTAPMLTEPGSLEPVLLAMGEAELLYRFPVAIKFAGEFGPDRQLRLNCWGRRLAERATASTALTDPTSAARTRIRNHLTKNRHRYHQHMQRLAHLSDHPAGTAWRSATQLPVGVLT